MAQPLVLVSVRPVAAGAARRAQHTSQAARPPLSPCRACLEGAVYRTGLSTRAVGRQALRHRLSHRTSLRRTAASAQDEQAPAEEQPAAEQPKAEVVSAADTPAEAAKPSSADEGSTYTSEFQLNILWQEQFCGVSVDQVVQMNHFGEPTKHRTPVTEYFFWPKIDAWEELKSNLEAKPWISEREKIVVLNMFTDIVNYWQEVHSRDEAMEKFGDKVLFPN